MLYDESQAIYKKRLHNVFADDFVMMERLIKDSNCEYSKILGKMDLIEERMQNVDHSMKEYLATQECRHIEEIPPKIEDIQSGLNTLKSEVQALKKNTVSASIFNNRISRIEEGMLRCLPIPALTIATHIVDHCNLNCKNCDNYSPIAKEFFVTLERFEKDLSTLSNIFGEDVKFIKVLGGEPLLHPELNELLRIARRYHSYTEIQLVTNGIKLLDMPDQFWSTCRDNAVTIVQTKYPIKLDSHRIEQRAAEANVSFRYYGNTEETTKTSMHIPLDPSGQQNEKQNFFKCYHANNCIILREGKLYTCTTAAFAHLFNAYFDMALHCSASDSIDIYGGHSKEEILNFLSKPIPFCKYCNVNKRTFGHEWAISKKEISEWTI